MPKVSRAHANVRITLDTSIDAYGGLESSFWFLLCKLGEHRLIARTGLLLFLIRYNNIAGSAALFGCKAFSGRSHLGAGINWMGDHSYSCHVEVSESCRFDGACYDDRGAPKS